MKKFLLSATALLLLVLCQDGVPAAAQQSPAGLTLGAPSDVIGTGVLDPLLADCERRTGVKVQTVTVESRAGAGPFGAVDVLLSDSPFTGKLLAGGTGHHRAPLMRSSLVLVGPREDRAGVRGTTSVLEALRRIASPGAPFLSRGDGSGTGTREAHLWSEAGVNPRGREWYRESGRPAAETLKMAAGQRAYTLVDRAVFITSKDRFSLEPLVRGDPRLIYIYEVIDTAPQGEAGASSEKVGLLLDYLASERAREIIGKYGLEKYGIPLYSIP